ncbi:protein HIRA homolog, partial [Ctenocephalides felis]|uniref:protein HIRA homolog n=1 Tax=Ctenocephalides felis TaxID=7515 RepID=UPI000E6E52B0
KPIFSIDVHPSGNKLATGGQGGDSGRVVIWNWAPLVSLDAENDPNVPKILCLIDQHSGNNNLCNCVRWSWSGTMLASAGDDKLIKIWKKGAGTGGTVFGSKVVNKEARLFKENCSATLQIHQGDILDLSWSPGDRWLMSCSVDNTIIIWDTTTFTVKEQLSGHTGMVKGVVWDPVGKYLASQSDDKSVRVWRTSDWMQEAVITEPFAKCGGTTHVLRLSWSPDGQYLVSAHAMNGRGPTAQIIERDGWSSDKDFVGHRKAVTCVRFNNNIMERGARPGARPVKYCCLAMGSRDCALSVWCTSDHRPLFAIHDLFTKSVMDLSWSADGLSLLACSWDGSVACLHFKSEEMGRLLTSAEKNALYERLYGQSAENINDSGNRTILESCDLLDETIKPVSNQVNGVEETRIVSNEVSIKDQSLNVSVEQETIINKSQPPPTAPKPINKQIETRTSDGKRRITPMFIPANVESNSLQNGTSFPSSAVMSNTKAASITNSMVKPSVTMCNQVTLPKSNVASNRIIDNNKTVDESPLDNKLKRALDLPSVGPAVPEKNN